MRQWKKAKHETLEYFTLNSGKYEFSVARKDEISKDILHDYFDKKYTHHYDWGHFVSLERFNEKLCDDTVVPELPFGSYQYKPDTAMLPNRLEVVSTRNDGYIPLEYVRPLVKDIQRFLGA